MGPNLSYRPLTGLIYLILLHHPAQADRHNIKLYESEMLRILYVLFMMKRFI